MKAIKRILIVFAIIGVLVEGLFIAVKFGAQKEINSVKTNHTSYACEVTQSEGTYNYSYEDKTYSEAEYTKLLEDAFKGMDLLIAIQSSLLGFYIIGAAAAGKSVKKREETAQAAIC